LNDKSPDGYLSARVFAFSMWMRMASAASSGERLMKASKMAACS
jgi:hypothetical protein